mmetsp:Transcript_14672/g.23764  ORF Transcript_14672/g.23764 Transcript_14672/m.23764 type:complete len:80 (-) Transcript_14672:224-463(-)
MSSPNADCPYDKTGRLTNEDKEMMGHISLDKCNLLERSMAANSNPAGSGSNSLSSTPQNTSFMTEENMKKILMPKKIEF